ncbi:MAG TPA: polyprenyl synthetase [Saprospirales bacterium]|nr:polyprenyl synthetase [Saprospirales bacterium]HAY70987.1 polyprenyl synthetase [Saprospirales bacterium]HRQ28841.1 polyprenyl synthetase family protein [Saprospiraceae bacterium]
MGVTLDQIKKPVSEELEIFEKFFQNAMKSNVSLLDKITYYIVKRKGKQIRPMYVLLSAKMFGPVNNNSYIAAAMIELMHTATLVHDDVVDDANERRGYFSVNALWKNKIAVLVGDYLLAKGLFISVESQQIELLKILSATVKNMSEGELLQIQKARKLDIVEDVYYDIIRQKTASLIAASCSIGAATVSEDPEMVSLMYAYGESIGMAFQIKDDLFDYGTRDIGKPLGIDIKEKKMTLPLIHVLQKVNKKDKRYIINTIKNHNEDKAKVDELIAFIKENGGLEYANAKMMEFKSQADKILLQFPDNEYRKSLLDLSDYVINRSK